MVKKLFYTSAGRPHTWRIVMALCLLWVVLASVSLHMVIESNMVGQLIQYVKAEIAK